MGEFGDFINQKRRENKYTLMNAAKILGISFSYLSDIEQGRKLPPNSTKKEHKELLKKMKDCFKLTDKEYDKLLELADKELVDKGHLSNDITEYMSETPFATMALRKATNKKLSDKDWKKIIEGMDKM